MQSERRCVIYTIVHNLIAVFCLREIVEISVSIRAILFDYSLYYLCKLSQLNCYYSCNNIRSFM